MILRAWLTSIIAPLARLPLVLSAHRTHRFAVFCFFAAICGVGHTPSAIAGGFWGPWLGVMWSDPHAVAQASCDRDNAGQEYGLEDPPDVVGGFNSTGTSYSFFCGTGLSNLHGVLMTYVQDSKNPGCGTPGTCTDHPFNIANGNKFLIESDYRNSGPFPMQFTRYFNSGVFSSINFGALATQGRGLGGFAWRHSYDRVVSIEKPTTSAGTSAAVSRADGKAYLFTYNGSAWLPPSDVTDKLERLFIGSNPAGWKLTAADGDYIETFNVQGQLTSITNRAGLTQTLAYDGLRLSSVTDPFGRTLTFTYDAASRIQTMTDPSGGIFTYAYSAADLTGKLVSVTYPDNTIRQYVYEQPEFPFSVTGIIDENNNRYSTYQYYIGNGWAMSSQLAGGADFISLQPNTHGGGDNTTTDAFGLVRTYTFVQYDGSLRNTSISGPPCPSCGPAVQSYDTNGFPASRTDWNGNRTNYEFDSRGLERSRTEGLTATGSTTPQTRIITTDWHTTFRLPTLITEPGRTTTMTYDPVGNLNSRTITDTVLKTSRTWNYPSYENGQVKTIDGPRTDVTDVTTYTYYANGNIETITNALGHVTQITAYNAHGQPLTIVDPNGLTTTLGYDLRQRLISRNVGGELTIYDYYPAGQLKRVTMPDNSFLNYTYDAAHRLTQIDDSLGNRIVYTLDAMGNRHKEEVSDPLGVLKQTLTRNYGNLNLLFQVVGATNQTTTYGYDNQGNLTTIDGPLTDVADVTTNTYDALNRLASMTDPNSGQTTYDYNALDQMRSVTDPNNFRTNYTYDAFNNLRQLQSPDTGTTQYPLYDEAGNLKTQIDAKGQTTTYTYDALNRVATIGYTTDPSLNVVFTYDQGTNGKGRLTGVTDSTGTISYAYDPKGRLTSETRVINGVTYVTGYSYDAFGRMAGITYPTGRQITYTPDGLGRIYAITTTKDGATQTVLSNADYHPFGPLRAFTFGNNQNYIRGIDQDGRIYGYTLGSQAFKLIFDNASRVKSITDLADSTNQNTYDYDTLDRLERALLPSTVFLYSYDATGNRLSRTVGSATETYGPVTTSNRLPSLKPATGPLRTFVYDDNGSTKDDAVKQFTYDARGRLIQTNSSLGAVQYGVNSLGQRIRKISTLGDTVYHYDSGGRLIAETSAGGTVKNEYIYLGDIPVAVIK